MKQYQSDLAYTLYASGISRPSGYVTTTGGLSSATAPSALRSTWSHVALTFDRVSSAALRRGRQVASAARTQALVNERQPAHDRRQQGLGRVVLGRDRRGAHLRPGAHGRRDPDRYDHGGRRPGRTTAITRAGPNSGHGPRRPLGRSSPCTRSECFSNGKVAVWDGFGAALNSERIWNPETGQFESAPSGINLFCSGHALLPGPAGGSPPAAWQQLSRLEGHPAAEPVQPHLGGRAGHGSAGAGTRPRRPFPTGAS